MLKKRHNSKADRILIELRSSTEAQTTQTVRANVLTETIGESESAHTNERVKTMTALLNLLLSIAHLKWESVPRNESGEVEFISPAAVKAYADLVSANSGTGRKSSDFEKVSKIFALVADAQRYLRSSEAVEGTKSDEVIRKIVNATVSPVLDELEAAGYEKILVENTAKNRADLQVLMRHVHKNIVRLVKSREVKDGTTRFFSYKVGDYTVNVAVNGNMQTRSAKS